MSSVLAAIIPVVLAITAGVLVRQRGILNEVGAKQLNKLVYWVCFPAFLVWKFGTAEAGSAQWPWRTIAAEAIAVVVMVLVVMIGLRRLGAATVGSVISIAFRSNGAFVGLPIVTLLAAEGLLSDNGVREYLLLLALAMPLFNVMSVIGFVTPHHGLRLSALKPVLFGILTNPILWGGGIGLLLAQFPEGWRLGGWVEATVEIIGRPAVPLALLGAGASLQLQDLKGIPAAAWLATVGKLFAMPALALGLAAAFGATPEQQLLLAVIAAAPTAVASVPMASELGGNVKVMATGVVLTTLLSPITMAIWLWLYS